MISTVLGGIFFFGYDIVSIAYVFAVFFFIGYALKLVAHDVNSRYGIFGDGRKSRIYEKDAKDIFGSESIYASHYSKEITIYSPCIANRSVKDLEAFAIAFGKIHHPNLKPYFCIEKGDGGHIRYREEMTVWEIKESPIDDAEARKTPHGEQIGHQ